LALSQAAFAQKFPDRPITLLVPYAAGGPAHACAG
jgi:tripartite-type tricarboxylate transporter receptor subunit TctC